MTEFRYLAIRNWAKFQARTDKHGRTMDGRCRPYIRDYTDKECDSDYVALGFMTRYLLDACRRLRGKYGRNLRNDPMWILRQLNAPSTDRGRGVHGIETLVRRGFLIPTNQEFDSEQKPKTPLEVDLEVDVKVQNTKASASPTHSINNSQFTSEAKATPESKPKPPNEGKPKPGRPVLTTDETKWVQGLAKKMGFPNLEPRDYSLAVQFREKTGWNMDAIVRVIDLRAAGSIETFKSIGDVFSAAIGHEQYLARR